LIPAPYFKGLHSLRFFAAFLVIIYHCNDALKQVNSDLGIDWPILMKGSRAVNFFFILSGFLITYLALHEYENFKSFDYKRFLKKRILRIVPLYYLAVILGFLLIRVLYPQIYGKNIFEFSILKGLSYYLLFLPNIMAATYTEVGPLRSLWSIGVEEQFYLLFPIIFQVGMLFKKFTLQLLGYLLLSIFLYFYIYSQSGLFPESIQNFFLKYLRIHFILFGCLTGSIFYKFKGTLIQRVFHYRGVQISIYIGIIMLLFLPNEFDPHNLLSALFFALLLVMLSSDISPLNLEYQPLIYLGSISYGLYIFHPYVSIFLRFLMQRIELLNGLVRSTPIIFYSMVFLITVLISHFSYKYYESYFLKFK
jgi:peptidoglycan/LPS O-acetylase OafA/YrhL